MKNKLNKIIATAMIPIALSWSVNATELAKNNKDEINKPTKNLIYKEKIKKNRQVLAQVFKDSLVFANIENLEIEQIRKILLNNLNKVRNITESLQLEELQIDEELNKFAQSYSKHLFDNWMDDEVTYKDHKDINWVWLNWRIKKAWLVDSLWYTVWENLASTKYNSIHDIMKLRIHSKPHLMNIVDSNFKYVGIWHQKWSNNLVLVFHSKKMDSKK